MAIESRELRGRHFERRTEDGMDRDGERHQPVERVEAAVGLNEEARDMRNAGRRLATQEDESDLIATVNRLKEAVREQENNNRQLARGMGDMLKELRQIVSEVERIRTDAQDESHTAQQAALYRCAHQRQAAAGGDVTRIAGRR